LSALPISLIAGEREVLDFVADQAEAQEQQQPAEGSANGAAEDRPILDEMIARLQQDHDERAGVADNNRSGSQPNASNSGSLHFTYALVVLYV